MTREQLKAFGLEKDVIDKVMDIHGADVENAFASKRFGAFTDRRMEKFYRRR